MTKTNGYYVRTPSSGQLPKLNNCKLYNFKVCNDLLYRRSTQKCKKKRKQKQKTE